jgi:serine protease Do
MGLSFAIPSSVVRPVVEQLKEKGYVSRGWLGVSIQEVDKRLAQSFGLSKPEGALVAQVMPNSPAEQAGLTEGDVILAFDGKPILYAGDLSHQVGLVAPNTRVSLIVMRHGKQQTVDVTVGELADRQARSGRRAQGKGAKEAVNGLLGLQLEAVDRAQAGRLHIVGGVRVKAIRQGGAAAKAGLQPGDIIVQVGFDAVDSAATFQKVVGGLPEGSIQPIRFFRDGRPIFRSIVIE